MTKRLRDIDDDFYIVGNKDRLAVVRGDKIEILENPFIKSMEMSVDYHGARINSVYNDDGLAPSPTPQLRLALFAEEVNYTEDFSQLPKSAENMNVKELLDLVNKKIKER